MARAARDAERIRFSYCDASGVSSERYVEPYHVVPVERRWYLAAWDLDRGDWRVFRLDRITAPQVTKRRFDMRPLPAITEHAEHATGVIGDAAQFVTERLSSLPKTDHVDVVVETSLAAVERELG